jgi:hypothetical protein
LPNYSYATLTDAENAVLARLYDNGVQNQPVAQFWTRPEIDYYIREALRSWNAYTSFWRSAFPFSLTVTTVSTNWYDLAAQPGSLRPYTVTDQYLVNEIEYHLLEPQTTLTPTPTTPATWTGSNQFRLSDIYDALTRRQNECLSITGCTITQTTVPAAIVRRTLLGDRTLDIRRVAWMPQSGLGYSPAPLRQSDNWELQAFNPNWTAASQGAPRQWMQTSEPPPSFDVDRIPAVPGNYDVLTVNSGPVSNPTSAQLMAVPDDWSFVPKWGAMADLLSKEANAKDVGRAQYCQQRFSQDSMIMMDSAATLGLQLNGIPLFVDSVRNGDDFNPNWQAQTPMIPRSCYQAGLNILGFPNPDQAYGILALVVQNAPVPTKPGDFIQIARGDYDSMINEAQHLAMFKQAGAEFYATIPLHQAFLKQAAQYNSKLSEMGSFWNSMSGISQRNEKRNPRMVAQ